MREIWKDIAGYEGQYQVSSLGRVKSLSRIIVKRNGHRQPVSERVMSQFQNKSGYMCVNLRKDAGIKQFKVHRLVATAFLKKSSNRPQINHKDGSKKNNTISNLEWCTATENNRHAVQVGLHKTSRGELNGQAKLSRSQVEQIREACNKGVSQRSIAKRFGISQSNVSLIANKKGWE